MKIHRIILIISALLILALTSFTQEKVDIEDVVKKLDELYRSETSYARMKMTIVTTHWERTLELEAWSKGMDQTFILINSPKKEKGTATLRIGNEMWNYLPKTDKVMKIPPSMMSGSWMGSDFTNDDLVRETSWLDDYEYKFIQPDYAEEGFLYIEYIPKEDVPTVWTKVVEAVRESDYLPAWSKFYDEKGELIRTMNLKNIQEMGGKKIPTIMELIPEDEEGNKTTMEYIEAKFSIPLDDDIFSLRNLRKKR